MLNTRTPEFKEALDHVRKEIDSRVKPLARRVKVLEEKVEELLRARDSD